MICAETMLGKGVRKLLLVCMDLVNLVESNKIVLVVCLLLHVVAGVSYLFP